MNRTRVTKQPEKLKEFHHNLPFQGVVDWITKSVWEIYFSGIPLLTILLIATFLSACAAPVPTPTVTETPPPPVTPFTSSTAPPGRIRPAAVAGEWYPDDPDELTRLVDEMLASVDPVDGEPIALIVPHAGYVYSGPVAAFGFKQLKGVGYDVAVVIASDHVAPVSSPISVWAEGGFETPLGIVPVDVELAQALLDADDRITFDSSAHTSEHPIEIELPFLQRVCPECSIVPVLMGSSDTETVQTLTDALLAALANTQKRVVIIASSDLSHYPNYDDAQRADGATLSAIETGDPAQVRDTIQATMAMGLPELVTCACGEGPILVAMRVAQGLDADTTTVLTYANSGDASGGRSQVVGYGAVMLWRYQPPIPTEAQQEELLALARKTIAEYLETSGFLDYETNDVLLTRHSGAFVTLREHGELRGCIGHTRADGPLYKVVQQTAVTAATGDPRFPPLTPDGLSNVAVEISILSPFRRVTDTMQIEVGVHGLMIYKGNQRGLLLPQVPVEQGWDRDDYLNNLCLKAGLPLGCWQEGATLYAFTAVVFGEEE
ncbi:MAG: AmmeMemoRadiSam system protein B [Chloroflexi bacterium]|nr:AmmeMemoRadiSam system protein B [Chloroflexota bacterium]